MADQNITELPIKTNTGVASTDYMLGIDSAEGYQILVRDVAKYIVENYNGSTIAGSAQTIQSAVNALNSNLATASTKNSGNLGANITGWADYVQFGKIVLVQFVLTNASELTSNSKIVTGLPRPDRSYTIGDFKLFNSNVYFRIADDGSVVVTGNIASGANLRGAVTYIAN